MTHATINKHVILMQTTTTIIPPIKTDSVDGLVVGVSIVAKIKGKATNNTLVIHLIVICWRKVIRSLSCY